MTRAPCLSLEIARHTPTGDRNAAAKMIAERGKVWVGRYFGGPLRMCSDATKLFGADFAIPRYDAELDGMLRAEENAPVENLSIRVEEMQRRVRAIGGEVLVWG